MKKIFFRLLNYAPPYLDRTFLKKLYAFLLILLPFLAYNNALNSTDSFVSWAVIGAGPAGIIATSILIENGEDDIVWIDPEFKVGRLGKYYGTVPSNLKAARYTIFLQSCTLFREIHSQAMDRMRSFDQQQEPVLQAIIDPLQDITNYLVSRINIKIGKVNTIECATNNLWKVKLGEEILYAKKVLLALGSFPKTFTISDIQEIPLDTALNETKLSSLVSKEDKIIVVGSAHSALLVVKYLSELGIEKVLNLYTKEPKYGMYGGLEGITAYWSKHVLQKNLPSNVIRLPFSLDAIEQYKGEYNKIIYAFSYQRNPLIINGLEDYEFNYNTGEILPNLYGIGIAFPEKYTTEEGDTVNLIGVNSFMAYAKKQIPQWIKW